jgi:hypothetical protein
MAHDKSQVAKIVDQLFDALPSAGGPAFVVSYAIDAIADKAAQTGLNDGPGGAIEGTLASVLAPLAQPDPAHNAKPALAEVDEETPLDEPAGVA